ncbi:hypothetical protein [Streptomyces sp. NPDC050759]|uniref:hypothetical protein n=1 Tax=Streptomyces sp. NPDC050759 TaxID=3365635 RepID=UPI0037A62775
MAYLAPDAVIDLVCFTLEAATALVERLCGEIGHLLHRGTGELRVAGPLSV